MDLVAAVLGGSILFFFLFTVFAFHFQRLRWKRRKRLGKKELGFCPTFSSLGNALQAVNRFAQPQAKIVMQVQDEAEDPDDEEIPAKTGPEHLHRQLQRVRNGDDAGKLTVLVKLWRS